MKFSLTVSDLTLEEALKFIHGGTGTDPLSGKIGGAIMGATSILTGNADNGATAMPSEDDNGAPNLNAPGVDIQGLPHDIRIHSDNKGLNKDGSWRKRRGVDAAMVTAVEAELKMRAVQQLPPQYQQPPNTAPMMPHVQQQPIAGAPYIPPQPQYSPPPGNPNYPPQDQQPQYPPQYTQQPPQQPAVVAMDFQAFMQHLSGNFTKLDSSGRPMITAEYLASVAQRLSTQTGIAFTAITDLASNPNAIPLAVQIISADQRWN